MEKLETKTKHHEQTKDERNSNANKHRKTDVNIKGEIPKNKRKVQEMKEK